MSLISNNRRIASTLILVAFPILSLGGTTDPRFENTKIYNETIAPDVTAHRQKLAEKEFSINAIIADPLIAPHYQNCKKDTSQTSISSCIWNKLGELGLQEKVMEKYFSPSSSENKDSTDLKTAQQFHVKTPHELSETVAIQKLSEYMEKKLEEAIYGDIKAADKVTKVADHQVFYRLFKQQVSQNIITSISSYCIEANPLNGHFLSSSEEKRKEQRSTNLKNVQNIYTDADGNSTSQAYDEWGKCLTSLASICRGTSEKNDSSEDDEDLKYSRSRACRTTAAISQLRASLLATAAIENNLNENISEAGFATNVKIYSGKGEEKGKSINDLTSISSNEAVNDSGLKAGIDQEVSQIDQCLERKDIDFCRQFFKSDKEKELLENSITSAELENKVAKERIEKMDKEFVAQYLKSQGRTQETIERAIASDDSLASIRAEIGQQIQNERQAVIDSLKAKFKDNTIGEEEKDFAAIETKVQKIKKELQQQGDGYAQMIHYSNLVSGFLSIADSSGAITGRNQAAISNELANSAFDPNNARDPASASTLKNEGYFSALAEKLKDFIGDSQEEADSTPVGVDTINAKILKYSTIKEDDSTEEQE